MNVTPVDLACFVVWLKGKPVAEVGLIGRVLFEIGILAIQFFLKEAVKLG